MNKKKIAIMTWYKYKNFGTALQASAIYHIIESLGYNTTLIQYEHKGNINEMSIKSFAKALPKKIIQAFNGVYISDERDMLYSEYLYKRVTETKKCVCYSELYDLNEFYDAFVCGSDQIWSPLGFDDKYFLSFVYDKRKMIAYAPSIGTPNIENPIIREKMADLISQFSKLSVRESQGVKIIQELVGKEAKNVLDPTLLLTSTEWDIFADTDKTNRIDAPYILCYFLGDDRKYLKYVKKLSKTTKLPFYIIPITRKQKEEGHAVPFEVGPSEFVSLIKNAKYVCTDSFHGMAFSINYHIPFFAFKRFANNSCENQNSRIFSLLKLLKLEDRIVDKFNNKNMLTCSFVYADKLLNEQRELSIKFLQESLADATNSTDTSCNSVDYSITDLCCGCGSCVAICPKNAITISKNEEGFEHYSIDYKLCIKCKKCKAVCPMQKIQAPMLTQSKSLYSAKSNSKETLATSSSGGVGYEIAKAYQKAGYYICGCMYDTTDNSAKHIIISPNESEKLSLLQGSKYIQSSSAQAIQKVAEISQKNKVVFFGMPCQIAGLNKLLEVLGRKENVLLVDLICHGIPTYYLWEKYLSEINKVHNLGTNPYIEFRSKKYPWREPAIAIYGNGNKYIKSTLKDDFYAFFRRGLCHMKTCMDCPYREKSSADLRIGDYWGERFKEDNEGVSMIISNTEKGEKVISLLNKKNLCHIQKQELNEYWSVQIPYNSQRPFFREKLINELKDDSIRLKHLRKKYCNGYDFYERYAKYIITIKKIIRRVIH